MCVCVCVVPGDPLQEWVDAFLWIPCAGWLDEALPDRPEKTFAAVQPRTTDCNSRPADRRGVCVCVCPVLGSSLVPAASVLFCITVCVHCVCTDADRWFVDTCLRFGPNRFHPCGWIRVWYRQSMGDQRRHNKPMGGWVATREAAGVTACRHSWGWRRYKDKGEKNKYKQMFGCTST